MNSNWLADWRSQTVAAFGMVTAFGSMACSSMGLAILTQGADGDWPFTAIDGTGVLLISVLGAACGTVTVCSRRWAKAAVSVAAPVWIATLAWFAARYPHQSALVDFSIAGRLDGWLTLAAAGSHWAILFAAVHVLLRPQAAPSE